ncbi:MAG: aminotransferase class I/II-fold pyridoxal phosphate-dependent enzyme [Bacteroidetes bacterium]|nr:MAG: aminotransferase class I/II-fold pyridoxal phosphate-dependent enzyme [Bacteroidota bacterium]
MQAEQVQSKLPAVGTTIFTIMSALANEYKAINLSQGFPDFEVSEELISLVHEYMKKGFNQYAPMAGHPALREQIALKTDKIYHRKYNPDTEITITSGGTQAIYTAIAAIVKPGDEVIVIEPAYDSYVPAILLNGGIPVLYSLYGPDFKIDWTEFAKLISHKTKLIIINTPHNPAGTIFTEEDLNSLSMLLKDTGILIISDEVYEHIIFDGLSHQSVIRFPELLNRSFVVFSFGKTYHATGWKMGYCLAPEYLMKEFRKVHQFLVFSSNTPLQHSLAEYMKNANYLELPSFYQNKRDFFLEMLHGSGFSFTPSKGSYFQLLDYSGISNEKDTEFAIKLTRESGVASIPLSPFYKTPPDQHYLRFCFAKKSETLASAAEKLRTL